MTRLEGTPWVAVALVAAALVAAALVPGPASAHANHVSVDAQVTADGSVLVEAVFAADEAWVAVHADDGGDPGDVIGTRRVGSGFRTDLRVDLADGAANRTAWVVLHGSDDDDSFEPGEDEPLESFGSVVAERFHLAVGDRPAAVSAERFRPQNATDGSVVVRRVVMPADGRLAIHADADGPGEVVASRSLSAGVHENVTVDVPASFLAGDDAVTAWAVVHLADDATLGNDTALRVGSGVVGTSFGVRGGPAGATDTATGTPTGTTASPTPTGDDDGGATATGTPSAAPATTGEEAAARGSGPGLGVGAAVAALVAFAALALGRRMP